MVKENGNVVLSRGDYMGEYTMRKITFLFCVLMIVPTLALASGDMMSISELRYQVEAMGRWTKTYEAHGRTIEVDVPIIVPEVEEFPVFSVEPYYAVYEQHLTRDGTALEKIGEDGGCSVYAESNLFSEDGITGKVEALDLDDFKCARFYANYFSPRDDENINTKYTSEFFYPYQVCASNTYAEDNLMSLEDAEESLEKVIGYFYPEESSVLLERIELCSRLHKVKGIDDYELGDYVENYPSGTYNLSIRQMMDGIPIYTDIGSRLSLDLASDKGKKGVNSFWRKNVKIMRVRKNTFEFMNKSRFELNTVWLKRINKIEEDVPLQNVDIIINNLEKEIERGKIRRIYALKLGYCVYFSDEGENIYTIYPIWMCECDYTESAKEELKKSEQIPDERKQYYYKQLVINAQTGQIEPYLIEKQELAYCPRVITWEEVH